jgi:hypothetical protein
LPKREPTPPAEVSFRVDIWGVGMHFYQFHIGDYKSHTHHLSLIEDLAFRLLDHYYLHEAPIKQRDIARQMVWQDWLQLRKSKKASVTETVVKGARAEAGKLGWELERFLVEWCTRGSQGLKAEWVNDKSSGMTKTGQMNQTVMSGLTRGLIGGGSNVKLLKG